jgi:pimeloyl-ACP methyl ester carboxylesterase
MAIFVLVHGSWQGAWCWREVLFRLEALGHRGIAFDLPAHGEDRTPPEQVTLQDYADAVVRVMKPLNEPSILVGHSMGGVIIAHAAGLIPHRVRALVNLAALLPPPGSPMMALVEGFDPRYLAQLLWAEDGRTARISLEGALEFLYHRCPDDVARKAHSMFTAEPVAPYEAPFHPTTESCVPTYYIECLQDRVVLPELRQRMLAANRFRRVYQIDTDHAPQLSAPDELAACLGGIDRDL